MFRRYAASSTVRTKRSAVRVHGRSPIEMVPARSIIRAGVTPNVTLAEIPETVAPARPG